MTGFHGRSFLVYLAICGIGGACGSGRSNEGQISVGFRPSSGPDDQALALIVSGRFAPAKLFVEIGQEEPDSRSGFAKAWLGQSELDLVNLLSLDNASCRFEGVTDPEGCVAFRVPSGLAPGPYPLKLRDAMGRETEALDPFMVTRAPCENVDATTAVGALIEECDCLPGISCVPRCGDGVLRPGEVCDECSGTCAAKVECDPDAETCEPQPQPQCDLSAEICLAEEAIKVDSISIETVYSGQYGIRVFVDVANQASSSTIAVVGVLRFSDPNTGMDRTGDFRQRETDLREGHVVEELSLRAGTSGKLDFVVDVLPWADPESVRIEAQLWTRDADGRLARFEPKQDSAQGTFNFFPVQDVVVNAVAAGVGVTSLSDAFVQANTQRSGIVRISFDPNVFPRGSMIGTVIELPDVLPRIDASMGDADGPSAVVLYARDGQVVLRPGPSLANSNASVMAIERTTVLYGLRWERLSEMIDDSNDDLQLPLAAPIQINSGNGMVLDSNFFRDIGVEKRGILAHLVRFAGGRGHRMLRNTFRDTASDPIRDLAATLVEFSENRVLGEVPGPGMHNSFLQGAGDNADIWLVGNVLADLNGDAFDFFPGSAQRRVYLAHNTFVRLPFAIRATGSTPVELSMANNLFLYRGLAGGGVRLTSNTALVSVESEGTDAVGRYCAGSFCAADIEAEITLVDGDFVGNDLGQVESWIPSAASGAVDMGTDRFDRNGAAPGRYYGAGPDLGALEAISP